MNRIKLPEVDTSKVPGHLKSLDSFKSYLKIRALKTKKCRCNGSFKSLYTRGNKKVTDLCSFCYKNGAIPESLIEEEFKKQEFAYRLSSQFELNTVRHINKVISTLSDEQQDRLVNYILEEYEEECDCW